MKLEELNRKFTLLTEAATLRQALSIFAKVNDSDWRLVVRLADGGYSILSDLEIDAVLFGMSKRKYASSPLSDLKGLLREERVIKLSEFEGFTLGEIRYLLNKSSRVRLLVLGEDDQPVGIYAEKEKGFYFKPSKNMKMPAIPKMGRPKEGGQKAEPPRHYFSPPGGFKKADEPKRKAGPKAKGEEANARPPARYTNTCLVEAGRKTQALSREDSLKPGQEYALRLNISPKKLKKSLITNAADFPDQYLPPSEEGHWLEVVVGSADFVIPIPRHHLFLPKTGPSWVCGCPPEDLIHREDCEHEKFLYIPVTAPEKTGRAKLRLGLYYANNLVESQLLTAQVGEGSGGLRSEIDFTLNASLADIAFLPPRALNIMTNHNNDGSHTFMIHGVPNREFHFELTEGQMRVAIEQARQCLRDMHMRVTKKGLFHKEEKIETLLDDHNGKSFADFKVDLYSLARRGNLLWSALFVVEQELGIELRNHLLKKPADIQITRARNTDFVFPWALVYDIPIGSDPAKYKPCELLTKWDSYKDAIAQGMQECPFEASHGLNTICPYGFWGFKHSIEQPPSQPRNGQLKLSIDPGPRPVHMVVGLSNKLNADLTREHLDHLGPGLVGFDLQSYDTSDEVRQALDDNCLELLYFYCHGKHEVDTGSLNIPIEDTYLEIGEAEKVSATDLIAWNAAGWAHEPHWKATSPLVFINGCHTADITPETLVSFVDAFSGMFASGVIGTEISVDQRLASEAAEKFFGIFKKQKSVGDSILVMRKGFLSKGNLLGLAYTPYCSADLKLI